MTLPIGALVVWRLSGGQPLIATYRGAWWTPSFVSVTCLDRSRRLGWAPAVTYLAKPDNLVLLGTPIPSGD